jgi:hypothetical protein
MTSELRAALASRRGHELIDFEHDRFAEPTVDRFARNRFLATMT